MKVWITGGAGDIAVAIKERLLRAGEYEIASPSRKELDVTDAEAVRAFAKSFKPDILVNNAGAIYDHSMADSDVEMHRRVINVDLFGPFNCTVAAIDANPHVRVVNVGSSAASKVHGTWSSYCAAKAGIAMATKCWASDGIDVVCLSPGRTKTKMRAGLVQNEDDSTLLKPEDYAETVYMAICGKFAPGTHIYVNVKTIQHILSGEVTSDNENI